MIRAYPVVAHRFYVGVFLALKRGASYFGGPKVGHIGAGWRKYGPIVGYAAWLGR